MTDTVEVYKAPDGWRWHRKAEGNYEIISQGEAYSSLSAAITGAERANPDVDGVEIMDVEQPTGP